MKVRLPWPVVWKWKLHSLEGRQDEVRFPGCGVLLTCQRSASSVVEYQSVHAGCGLCHTIFTKRVASGNTPRMMATMFLKARSCLDGDFTDWTGAFVDGARSVIARGQGRAKGRASEANAEPTAGHRKERRSGSNSNVWDGTSA